MNSGLDAISANGLTIGYRVRKGGWKKVHENMDFTLRLGELTSLIGLNGAGKSTLIRTLCRFQDMVSGSVDILGKSVAEYSALDFSRTVGVVLTDRTDVPGMTVRSIVSLGRQPHTGFFGVLSAEDAATVDEAMKAVRIYHKADSYIAELSDGERQRTMIAKAIAQECPIVVLDEPTAFLDVVSRMEIMELLHDMAMKSGKAIFLSTHDIDNAIMYSDKLLLLASGEPVCMGTPEELILDGSIGRFFSKSGMNFDVRSGRLSTGLGGIPVGVSGDGVTARWLSNALARNGFTPSLPSRDIVNILCREGESIQISYLDGTKVEVTDITAAVRSILENSLRIFRDEKQH